MIQYLLTFAVPVLGRPNVAERSHKQLGGAIADFAAALQRIGWCVDNVPIE